MTGQLTVTGVRLYEYVMPMKTGFGTARGVTDKARNFIVRIDGDRDGEILTGVGEGVPRGALTGDSRDGSWSFLVEAGGQLEGRRIPLVDPQSSLDTVRAIVAELGELAEKNASRRVAKPFRGALSGIDIALLDLVARAHGVPVSRLLGQQRRRIGVSAGTISTAKTRDEFEHRTRRDAHRFPMSRFKGKGELETDLDLLLLMARTNRAAGADKPVWIDVNEGLDPDQAGELVDRITRLMVAGDLPSHVIVEQPVAGTRRDELPALQRRADEALAGRHRPRTPGTLWSGRRSPSRGRNHGPLRLSIMADESLWDLDDLHVLHQLGGCGGINIKVPKAGGLLAALDLARAAVEHEPRTEIYVGGMLATSDLTSWALKNLAMSVPRLDYFTASPPSNVEARIAEPYFSYRGGRTHLLADQTGDGLGVELSVQSVGPYITRSARFPVPRGPVRGDEQPNRFDLPHLEKFGKKELDSHLLEFEALSRGLETVRYSASQFAARAPGHDAQVGFSWTTGVETSRVSTYVTNNKQVTRTFLRRAGVAVPEGRRFTAEQRDVARAYAHELGWPVVVKPQAGTGGKGVTTNVRSDEEFDWAVDAVSAVGYSDLVVERHVDGVAYRFVVLRDRVLSVVYRRPAGVVGEGVSTVAELIGHQNELRAGVQRLQTAPLRIDDRVRFQLDRQGLAWDSVPAAGRRVVVSTAGSVSQGGESMQVLDETHRSLLDEAVRAVRCVPGLGYAGVDFILADHRRPLADQDAAICEINASPTSRTNHFPLYGPARNVSADLLVDQCRRAGIPLGEPTAELCLDLEVSGLVQAVGYRQWIKNLARMYGVEGWVRNTGDPDLVEARLVGATAPVAAIASLAIRGPAKARPDYVRCRHHAEGYLAGGKFAVIG